MLAAALSCQVYDENLLVDSELDADDASLGVPGADADDALETTEPSPASAVSGDAPLPSGDAAAGDPLKNGLELEDEPAASSPPPTPSDSSSTSAPTSGNAGGASGASSTSTTDVGSQGGSGGRAGEALEVPSMGGSGGGAVSTGGGTSSGGTTSTGGSASSGDAGSTGGASAGGTGGSAGGAVLDSATWSFASDVDGWVLGVSSPTSLASQSSLSFSDSQGSPNLGALEVSSPFTSPGQMLAVQAPIAPIDLRGVTISAVVLLDTGLSSDAGNPSRIKLFAKSGAAYLFASGPDVTLQAGSGWVSVVFDVDRPSYVDPSGSFDPSDVREVGFEINSGSGGAVSAATLYIDSVDY